ncbi:MAG TPA: M20/M25/M40 family metallo-hydrolase [Acidimicrobiia bacterium]|nr:M20/M25/M40 family metallo-hydrolase [Acidimicrobiia bacterium]
MRSRLRSRRLPVVAVAHMDHPALVVLEAGADEATAELRGGVLPSYLEKARIEVITSTGAVPGKVTEFDSGSGKARLAVRGAIPGDIARWHFSPNRLGYRNGRLAARACDDLAGVAASLIALDRAAASRLHHFSVLLTRAEEVGFVGAISAAKLGTIPDGARVLSIECSPASADAPLGAGPVVRVGDAASIFSSDLTNRVSTLMRSSGLSYQRKLMAGGSCEATALSAMGLNATGLCLPLANHHNMVDVAGVRAGKRQPRLAPEEIDLNDFSGLIELLLEVASAIDRQRHTLPFSLEEIYEEQRHLLV